MVRSAPPPQKKRIKSGRMKRLQHARPLAPEKSKKSIRDCEDLFGLCPLDYPEMFANATGSVSHIDSTHTEGGVSR